MLYSIIYTSRGEKAGLKPSTHRTLARGQKMIVNENELRNIDGDIEAAARNLGGRLLSFGELTNEIKKDR